VTVIPDGSLRRAAALFLSVLPLPIFIGSYPRGLLISIEASALLLT
jgi:hypothetical protein